jgi:hypothetical protein
MSRSRHIEYNGAELAWIEANAHRLRREAHAEFCQLFGRNDVSPSNYAALCKRNGWLTGRTGQFEKGMESWNKGKPMPFHPNSVATRFKTGERRGVAVKLYKPIGTERMAKDGYLERKIHDGMPLQSRWRAVHLIRWEELNGPLPKGMALKCLDGDKRNTDPANWEAVPRALLPRLNGRFGRNYDTAPSDLKPAIMAIAKLEHAARERRRRDR